MLSEIFFSFNSLNVMQFGSNSGWSCEKTVLQILSIEASLWYILILRATTWFPETEKDEPAKSAEEMYC